MTAEHPIPRSPILFWSNTNALAAKHRRVFPDPAEFPPLVAVRQPAYRKARFAGAPDPLGSSWCQETALAHGPKTHVPPTGSSPTLLSVARVQNSSDTANPAMRNSRLTLLAAGHRPVPGW